MILTKRSSNTRPDAKWQDWNVGRLFYLPRQCRSVVAIDLFASPGVRRLFRTCPSNRSRFAFPTTHFHIRLFIFLFLFYLNFFNGRDVSIEMEKDVLFWSRQLIFRLPCIFVFYFLTYSNYLLSTEIFSQLQSTRSRSSILIDRFARATNSISSQR